MANNKYNELNEKIISIKRILNETILGQEEFIEKILITLLCDAHCIIEGVPGLAKTLTVKLLSNILDLDFNRIQFTPDLMPADIVGTIVLRKDDKHIYKFIKGPIFTNILLADEINRTPPKTQSALLQAMEERMVSSEGEHYKIEKPFNVFATQNPIEQEGTYQLPEAQLDRFMFKITIDYPSKQSEAEIIKTRKINEDIKIKNKLINKKELLYLQEFIENMAVGSNIYEYILNIVRNTRPKTSKINNVQKYVKWGASPRAGIYILLASKAKAYLNGRLTPDIEDIKSVAIDILRHRVILSFKGEMENVEKEDIIYEIVKNSN